LKVFTNINENIPKNCVASIGFFDGVHNGHLYLLEKLLVYANENNCENLIITLWPHPAMFFGKSVSLLNTLEEKTFLLEKAGVENLLILPFNKEIASMSNYDFAKTILHEELACNSLLMGYNNSFGNKNTAQVPDCELAIPVKRLTKFETEEFNNINSSQIRKCLQSGSVDKASGMLGYNYRLKGQIVSGYRIGRTIGFPTANVGNYDSDKILPANGVYIINAHIGESKYKAMLNIGTRPTFDGKEKSIEFHIPDFDGDLYNSCVEIEFLVKLRDEVKFADKDDLIRQLEADKKKTKAYFAENL
jgi:riboflavin kinase / FMN adenylyltransferase